MIYFLRILFQIKLIYRLNLKLFEIVRILTKLKHLISAFIRTLYSQELLVFTK